MSLAPVTLGSDKSGEALSGRRMLSEREAVPLGSEPGDKTAASLCSPLPPCGLHCTSPGKPGCALVPRGPWRAGPRPGSSSRLGADAPISPDLLSPQCSLRSALSTSSRRPTRPTAPPYPSQPESIFLCSGQYPSVDPRGLADSLETSLLPTQPEPSALLPNPPPPPSLLLLPGSSSEVLGRLHGQKHRGLASPAPIPLPFCAQNFPPKCKWHHHALCRCLCICVCVRVCVTCVHLGLPVHTCVYACVPFCAYGCTCVWMVSCLPKCVCMCVLHVHLCDMCV